MKSLPFEGECTINFDSSLSKLMRAARRGFITALVPSEEAKLRHAWYRKQKQREENLRRMMAAVLEAALSPKGEPA